MANIIAKGIDVSKWQGVIDWTKVKASGKVDFAIIRATCGTTYTDPQLAANVRGTRQTASLTAFTITLMRPLLTKPKKRHSIF